MVRHDETLYQITDPSDLGSVIAVGLESGRKRQLKIEELEPVPLSEEMIDRKPLALDAFTDDEVEIAKRCLEMIQPLVDMEYPGRTDFEKRALEVGRHYTTLYRWYGYYIAWKDVTVLVPRKRGWRKGGYRIAKEAEDLVADVIENFFLTPKRQSKYEPIARPTIEKTITEIRIRCDDDNIHPPSDSTIRQRINCIPEWERMQRRGDKKRARDKSRAVPGHFPNADFPLAVVQIDHTDVDIILVDDEGRESIGRVWLTLAMDVYSRMVTGYHLSLNRPSTTSVAMCLSHSFLPKERWLSHKGVGAEWPLWGFPRTIHADNAREFHAEVLQKACLKYNINLEFRPVKRPEYGGHIERLLGTFAKKIHALPGTTSSSVRDKGEYDSEKNASFDPTEFEMVLLELIANVYHQEKHKELEKSPLKQWEIGILGDRKTKTMGIGFPDKPGNPKELEIDFLPTEERTIQRTGVPLHNLHYYAPVLNRWIGARNPKDPKETRKFTFHYDPRNIETIWFWEPDVGRYYEVPTTNQFLPPMSLQELKEAKQLAREAGCDPKSPAVILGAHKRIREITKNAQAKTKRKRREKQRRKENERKQSPATVNAPVDVAEPIPSDELTDEPLEGFPVFR